MIDLTLTCKNNPKINGRRVIYKNLIYIGSDYSCDIFTPGKKIKHIHIFIEVVDNKLLVHLGKNVQEVHVAGKKTTSVRFFKRNEIISFLGYEIIVSDFSYNNYSNTKDEINRLTEVLAQSNGPILELIKEIQENE